ncbi:calcium:proton antiporter [Hydrogenophaga sp.]|uniref:calcium:proton antiporter n=1 Tax=Hydrogenophaga sp. TaxID=1904254 RepID=UPI00272FD2AF|nr:calcium:proton antiporter [Hydrogenophaga sp.]MDP2019078.1 calcium:proton antiporter [Hydrogenophaga sp.]MDP3165611.1 calcium:proton antiporter [Hydrogenophaga sp.]MDP3811542.1 calcium:proton antiporter [Hydrogenophaga sp.]
MKRIPASENAREPTTAKRLITPLTWALLLGAWGVVGLFSLYGSSWLAAPLTPGVASTSFTVLLVTIVAASFGVVHEADYLAHKLGEPYGTLVLTLSIVSIEVILIAAVLLGPGEVPTIGRDSIFAVLMIILNLVMGICLIAGAARHGEQEFNAQGATSYMSMIAVLTTVALVLPKFTSTAGEFSREQAMGIGVVTALLYAAFLWRQIGSHKRLFVQPPPGSMVVRRMERVSREPSNVDKKDGSAAHTHTDVWVHSLLLLTMIVPIVLLGHHLAVVLDYGIAAAGAPVAVSGVLIALIVFTPESLTAVRAALGNEMQRAVNLCLGAFVSTVGLTVPAVLAIGLLYDKQVIMGVSSMDAALFAATVVLSMLTFNGQRTSALQGYMHLALFAVFGVLLFFP